MEVSAPVQSVIHFRVDRLSLLVEQADYTLILHLKTDALVAVIVTQVEHVHARVKMAALSKVMNTNFMVRYR